MSAPGRLPVVIADDEPAARGTLRRLLERDPEVELVAECGDGIAVLERVRALQPSILFLDVRMPGLDGMRVLEELAPAERPAVVLTTAFDRYAVEAFEREAVDYLLKPFGDERFLQALERAKARVRGGERRPVAGALERLVRTPRPEDHGTDAPAEEGAYAQRLAIHRQGSVEVVEVARLVRVEAADQYVLLHVPGASHLMRCSLGELEGRLDPARFLRLHRSALVALPEIVRLESQPGGTGRALLRDGTWVPVSRSRLSTVRRRLGGAGPWDPPGRNASEEGPR